jgi:hypothetical protein
MLKLLRIQEVRWDRGGIELADYYTFFCGNENHQLEAGFFYASEISQQLSG